MGLFDLSLHKYDNTYKYINIWFMDKNMFLYKDNNDLINNRRSNL